MGKRRRQKRDIINNIAEEFRGSAEPICPYFGKCGGCLFQDIEYKNQLEIKKRYLNGLFDGKISVDSVKPSTEYNYRNRMDFVAAFGKRGLRQRGDFKTVFDIEQCPIMQKESNILWKGLRKQLENIEDYDYINHEGFLRYTVIRQAAFTKEVMCSFVVKEDKPLPQSLTDFSLENADSASVILSDGLADVSFGPVINNIKQGYITEEFDGIKYRIAPNSFFQSNSKTAVEMYRVIKENVYGNVMDLYSGVGSISLFVADAADSVTGVEIVEEAVSSAEENRKINEISNVNFVCQDARKFMRENSRKFDTLILDPPRAGIHPKMLKSIDIFRPETIIYMSCNPATFKDNLVLLDDYNLEYFEAFDMFPQTPHVETLAVMKRK